MARFYASIQGNRGEATRMGTPTSGISGHVRGWNVGVRVEEVYSTFGSNRAGPDALLGTLRRGEGCVVWSPANG